MDEANRVDMTAASGILRHTQKEPGREAKPLKMVAGAGFEPATYRL